MLFALTIHQYCVIIDLEKSCDVNARPDGVDARNRGIVKIY